MSHLTCVFTLVLGYHRATNVKMSPEGKALLNVVILGLGFMVMFTAFGTCGNIEVGFELQMHDLIKIL